MERMLARIREGFAQRADEDGFSGVVYVNELSSGKTLFENARGYALRSERLPNGIETRFQTASGSKVFTALAILQLVEQGRFALSASVADLLGADFPFGPDVTVRHLLTHTSGIPDYFEEAEAESSLDYARLWERIPVYTLETDRDFLPLFREKPVNFPPGERFSYCNAGFLTLGMIVARMSGMPFRAYVTQRVLQPAGMIGAGYFYADQLPGGCALGHVPLDEGGWRTNIFMLPYAGGGDGGAYVSAPEWARFWQALLDGRLLGAELLAEMIKPQTGVGQTPGRHYGLGVWINDWDDLRAVGVVGQDPGVEMFSVCFPSRDLHLAVLSNQDEGAGRMYEELRLMIFDC